MGKKSFKQLFEEAQRHDDYWASTAIVAFTEDLYRLMKEKKITKSELARKIKTSPAYITKVLRGNANFTLQTMIKLIRAVGGNLHIHVAPDEREVQWIENFELNKAAICARAVTIPMGQIFNVSVHTVAQGTAREWIQVFSSGEKFLIEPKPTFSASPGEVQVAKGYAYATA
jgi:transcriptional regulator with XRE-family HTH domain